MWNLFEIFLLSEKYLTQHNTHYIIWEADVIFQVGAPNGLFPL